MLFRSRIWRLYSDWNKVVSVDDFVPKITIAKLKFFFWYDFALTDRRPNIGDCDHLRRCPHYFGSPIGPILFDLAKISIDFTFTGRRPNTGEYSSPPATCIKRRWMTDLQSEGAHVIPAIAPSSGGTAHNPRCNLLHRLSWDLEFSFDFAFTGSLSNTGDCDLFCRRPHCFVFFRPISASANIPCFTVYGVTVISALFKSTIISLGARRARN
jgi:hypothetical protein